MPIPLVDELSFQYKSDGVVLNTNSFTPPFVDVHTITGLDAAPIRLTQKDHEGVDGGYVDSEFETTRVITIEGTVYAVPGQVEGYLDQLKANFAPTTTAYPFYFSNEVDDSTRFVNGKSQGFRYDWNQARRLSTIDFQVTILCEDPRIYSWWQLYAFVQLDSTPLTGRAYNRSYPMSYGAAGSANAMQLINDGNRPAPALFNIYGPVTNPKILNDNDGSKYLEYQISLATGEYLQIDLAKRLVRLNALANRRNTQTAQSRWFMLQPGNNSIRFFGVAGAGTPMVEAYWRHAWR